MRSAKRSPMRALSSGEWQIVGFFTSSAAEILLRRILALAIHSGTGSWQIAEKIEELPTESAFSCVPESLLKEIMEQVKNELKLASLAKQVTP